VYRFDFVNGQTKDTSATKKVIIKNINANGNGGAPKGHWTRTLVFDSEGRLYVAVGSNNNIDLDSYRAKIRRFTNFEKGNIDFS